MASKAFTAVARSVHTVMTDPDDDTGRRRLFGTPKNNLGRNDLPTLSFVIESYEVPTEEGQPIPANCYGARMLRSRSSKLCGEQQKTPRSGGQQKTRLSG